MNTKDLAHPRSLIVLVGVFIVFVSMILATLSLSAKKNKTTVLIPPTTPTPTPYIPPSHTSPVIQQLPDHIAPCEIEIVKITDLYTGGEAVYILPPGWPREKAILYSGHGHLVLSGGNIHAGKWGFWSANNPNKAVLIRVFGK